MGIAQELKSAGDPGATESPDFAAEFSQFRSDLEALKRDIAALTKTGAQEASDEVKRRVSSAEKHAQEAFDTASNEMQEIQRQAEKAVRKNPMTAIGAALAIGYFVATLRK